MPVGEFNKHQEGTKRQAEFIAKSIFLISGGALSVSMSIFLGDKAPAIDAALKDDLRVAWAGLFLSIVLYLLCFSVQVIRDYEFGERWRKGLNGLSVENIGNFPGVMDQIMWAFGIAAVVSFIVGFFELAYVAISIAGK